MNNTNGIRSIAQIFRKRLFVLAITAFILTIVAFWVLHTGISERNAEKVLLINLQDVALDILDEANAEVLKAAESCANELYFEEDSEASPAYKSVLEEYGFMDDNGGDIHQAFLKYVAAVYNVDEINVINNKGIIVRSTNPDFIGFDMSSGKQPAEFLCLLEEGGPDTFVQAYGRIHKNNDVWMKYAGQRLFDDSGFVQIGYNEDRYHELIDNKVQDITENRHVGTDGSVMIVRYDGYIVSSVKDELVDTNIEDCGYTIKDIRNFGTQNMVKTTFLGEEYNLMVDKVEGYYMIALLPTSEVVVSRNISIGMSMVLEAIIFVLMFVIIYSLINRLVVGNVREVAKSLNEITAGNLDVVVDVRGNREFKELSEGINQTVGALKNYVENEKNRLNADLEYAKEIQHSSLPIVFPPFPDHKEIDIYATMNPAREVGGDYYDFDIINGRYLMFSVADVSGKGIPAALFMMKAKTLVKSYINAVVKIDRLFEQVNNELCLNNEAGMFVTCWLGLIDLPTGVVYYINAGHNPPLIKRADGSFEFLRDQKPDFILGGMEGKKYNEREFHLRCGDELFLYTDGVTEATDKNGNLYGEERLSAFLNNHPDISCENKCVELRKDIDEFVGEAPQFDDITMMSIKYRGFDNTITAEAKFENYDEIMAFIDKRLEELECPMQIAMKVNVAADEVIANILNYAYGSAEGRLTVTVDRCEEKNGVTLRFVDRGIPFNPLEKEDPDISLSAEERKIGGLGIFMVKKMMDKVEYEYTNCNNLILTKYF